MPRRKFMYPLLVAFLSAAAVGAQAKDVAVTPAQVQRLEIKLAEVRPATTEAVALLPGTVVPAMNARIVAAAPFAGTVVQVHVLPGQIVKAGDRLATIASRELLDALSQLKQAEAELQLAEAIAQRKRSLVDKNISSPTVAEEAEAQVAKVRAVIEQHKRTVALGGIILNEGGQYTITASSSGKVVATQAMPGMKLDAMAAAVTIDTSNELWIEAQVPSDLVGRIQLGDKVQVINGPTGKVVSLAGSLDRMTRSAALLASVPGNSGLLAGAMVTVSLLRTTEMGGLDVPASSVAWIDAHPAVFVRSDAGFTLQPVTLRGKSPVGATVAGNLTPGQHVAASSLPQLESMLAGK